MGDALFELGRRTFDTPHFRGIEFIEVECKTILNKVPGTYLPFNWTINPYRGCSHACTYCQAGDTPILMADGRTKQLAELVVGDRIVGTEVQGRYRRYVTTEVLDHWSTMRHAFRVSLSDGTELIASADHRYLSDLGWKYVQGTQRGPGQRPHLTTNNTLLGPGLFMPELGSAVDQDTAHKIIDIEDLGVEIPMYDITTGTGDFIANGVISHNCFARATHTFLGLDAGRDFETKIFVKVNAPDVLRRQLRRKSWKGETIAMGTGTDPYQRAEGRYRLMPGLLEALLEVRNPFSILTKGTLILRDIDLIAEAAGVSEVTTAFSIGTLDEDVWRKSEPGTPHPRKRVEAVRKLNEAGIPCGVLVAPILPGISDSRAQLREVVTACLDAGATHVSPILLHLRPKVREVYMEWLGDEFPELVGRYEEMYTGSYANKRHSEALSAEVRGIINGHPRKSLRRRRRPKVQPRYPRSEQLSLL